MWFKNLQLLQLEQNAGLQPDLLEQQLSKLTFQPCGKVVTYSAGWVSPMGSEAAPLVYASNGYMIFCLKIQEKLLPSTVVREQLADQVSQLEAQEGRKLFRKEKERMKDEIYFSLLSQAFTHSSKIYAMIDPSSGHLLVDASSPKRLETFMRVFADSVKAYKAVLPELNSVPAVLTQWLRNNHYPRHFVLADACVLEDLSDKKGIVRFKNKDLEADNVQSFLREGCQVTQLSLAWAEQIQFTIKQDFSLTGVRFLDAVQDLAKDGMTETPEERFAADFVIMAETLRKFFADLLPHFVVAEEAVADPVPVEAFA